MTVFDTRALARPLFTDADFTATKWDGAPIRPRSQTPSAAL
jgi:hypothetical protein